MHIGLGIGVTSGNRRVPLALIVDSDGTAIEDADHPGTYWAVPEQFADAEDET
jgi:hypothetical protein